MSGENKMYDNLLILSLYWWRGLRGHPQEGYSGFQVTARCKWGHKLKPPKNPSLNFVKVLRRD